MATSLEYHLMDLLKYHPENNSNDDARQKYRVYGLLLSACSLRDNEPPDATVTEEVINIQV